MKNKSDASGGILRLNKQRIQETVINPIESENKGISSLLDQAKKHKEAALSSDEHARYKASSEYTKNSGKK